MSCTGTSIEVGAGRGQLCADQRKPAKSLWLTGNHSPEFWPEGTRNSVSGVCRAWGPAHAVCIFVVSTIANCNEPISLLSVSLPAGLLVPREHQCLEKAQAEQEHGACAQ